MKRFHIQLTFSSNYLENVSFPIILLIKLFEKYATSSSMIFRNVSICRSCKKLHHIFHSIWIKLIQMIFDKITNWMWIILQLLYRVFFFNWPCHPLKMSLDGSPPKIPRLPPPKKIFKVWECENHIEVHRHLDFFQSWGRQSGTLTFY